MQPQNLKKTVNSKSRIPVPVATLKSTHLNKEERNKDKNPPSNSQKLNKKITVNSCSSYKAPTKRLDSKTKNSNYQPSEKSKSDLQSFGTASKHNVSKKENIFNKKASSKRSEKCDTFKKEKNTKCTDKALEKNETVSNNVGKTLPVSKRNLFDKKKEVKLPKPTILGKKECILPIQDLFSPQNEIKFEANEFYRNMILSNRELSPSIMQRMPSLRLSTLQAQRPSVYQPMEISINPYREALEAIENVHLSAKRNEKIPIKEKILPISPFKERPSFYTPYTNPKDEVMNSLKQLKLQRMLKTLPKSTKKVTFNLNVQECSPIKTSMTDSTEETCECRLTQISENSKENTPLSPQNDKTRLSEEKRKCVLNPEIESSESCDSLEGTKTNVLTKSESKGSPIVCSSSGTIFTDSELPSIAKDENLEKMFIQKTITTPTKEHQILVTKPNLEQKAENSLHVASVKIYTPKPISLFANSKIVDSCSPEFLADEKSTVFSNYAPICTPLVLKNIAKNMSSPEANRLSPVCLKLDFAEMERGTPRNETSRKKTVITLENIETLQKKLDDLADQECFLLLLDENTSVVCGRYLKNPIAQILSEGDDMHFIPIQL